MFEYVIKILDRIYRVRDDKEAERLLASAPLGVPVSVNIEMIKE